MLHDLLIVLEEEGAAKSSLFSPDQFAGYAVTALVTVINIIVAYIVIKKFIYKPIIKMIHQRQEALDAELDAAAKSKEEADAVVADSKKTIDEARAKAAEIIEEARVNAVKQNEATIARANEEAAEILARAEEDCARMKRAALESMKDDLTDLAVNIAEHVIGESVSKRELQSSAVKYTDELVNAEVNKGE